MRVGEYDALRVAREAGHEARERAQRAERALHDEREAHAATRSRVRALWNHSYDCQYSGQDQACICGMATALLPGVSPR